MQHELLSLLPEYLPLGLGVYDKDGYLEYANGITLKMFGVTMKDIYGINIFDDPNIRTEDKELLKQGQDVSFETDYDFDLCESTRFYDTSIKNTRKYFLTKVTIMRDKNGNRRGYLLSCEEVTEKKAQEEKIRSAQRELSLALSAGKLISWNYQLAENMFHRFGYPIENTEKRSFEAICESIHPDDRERFSTLLDSIIRKQTFSDNNIVLRVLNEGSSDYRYSNFTFCPREDEKGNVSVITFVERDITEDFKYQQNLISAKNKAEEADKLKSTFLANMSHEIRTPLNAIVGFSELLSDATEPEEKNTCKQLIETNSEILLKLIGDILDLSKIEAGAIDISRHRLDINQLCEELHQSFKQRLADSGVTLKLINPYAKCIAELDKHRFIQIFTNFITNAIKYTPEGEIIMGYECNPGQIRIYVKDTGIGIPDEKKGRIFSRFEKLDNFAQGTGLGLSICKAIADETGGEIGFESKESEGSEFWYIGYTKVEFIEKSGQTVSEEPKNMEFYSPSSTTNVKNLNILVAEDNDSNFLLIQNILTGNCLTRAITGIEAVEKARRQTFDIILMDIRMPEMNGLEATTLIRKFDYSIPIIALTANAFDSDNDDAMAAGCSYFMTKPVKKQELTRLLSKYCR